ncbi:MAG: filament integrity protein FraC [Chroococcales cyanobacterium]
MEAFVVPLRLILFQMLLVLLSVAIEALVLHRKLKINRKTSVQYSLSINLLSNIVGWIVFFIVQAFLPPTLKYNLLLYIFLNVLNRDQPLDFDFDALFVLILVSTFVLIFITELKGLDLLKALLQTSSPVGEESAQVSSRPILQKRLKFAIKNTHMGVASGILLANVVSHGFVLLILLIRYWMSGS